MVPQLWLRFQRRKRNVTKLAAGAGVALGGKVIGRGVRLLVDVALARILGPASFGLYAIGWTITRMVTLITPLGLNIGVIRYGARFWRKDDARLKGVILQCMGLGLLSGVGFGALFYLAGTAIAQGIFGKPDAAPVIRWFALVFPLMTGVTVGAAATRISHRMKYGAIAEDMSEPIVQIALVMLVYLLGRGLIGTIGACVAAFGVALVLTVYYLMKLFPVLLSSHVKAIFPGKELMTYSVTASLTGVFGVLMIWVDRLFVGSYRPAVEVGIYQAASQLSIAFAIILSAFNAMFSPMAADLYHRGELHRLEELFRVSTKWGLYLSLPPFLVTCFAPKLVMHALFGHQYIAGWAALVILTFGQVVNAGTGPVGYLLVMTGHQKRMFHISATMFVISVILGRVLVPRWGMAGAAVATACGITGLLAGAIISAHTLLGMRPYDKRYLKGALATALATVVLFLLRVVHLNSPLLTLTLNTIAAFGVFTGVLLLTGLDLEDRKFIGAIRARLSQNGSIRPRQA